MSDWIKEKLTERERLAYRIAIRNAKDATQVDDEFFFNLVIQPERSKREDSLKDEMRCSEHDGNIVREVQ